MSFNNSERAARFDNLRKTLRAKQACCNPWSGLVQRRHEHTIDTSRIVALHGPHPSRIRLTSVEVDHERDVHLVAGSGNLREMQIERQPREVHDIRSLLAESSHEPACRQVVGRSMSWFPT